jgi:hypothetical protein
MLKSFTSLIPSAESTSNTSPERAGAVDSRLLWSQNDHQRRREGGQ